MDGMLVHVAAPAAAASIIACPALARRAADERAFLPDRSLPRLPITPQTDPVTARPPGCSTARRPLACCQNFLYQHFYEYWSRAGSLITRRPMENGPPLMDNVRILFLAGLQHFTPPFPPVRDRNAASHRQMSESESRSNGSGAHFSSPWTIGVREDKSPPDSRYRSLPTKYSLGRAT